MVAAVTNATVMGSPLQWLSVVRALRSVVPTNNNQQSATNTCGAWPSSTLDGLAYIISPLLPEGHLGTSGGTSTPLLVTLTLWRERQGVLGLWKTLGLKVL